MFEKLKRVVITDIAVVSSAGIGREAFFSSLIAGKTGLGPIKRLDCSQLTVKTGGEVDISGLTSPLPPISELHVETHKNVKALMAWNALQQISPNLPRDAAFMTTMGLECVDIDILLKGKPLQGLICPEIPPTLLPGQLWKAAGFRGPVSVQVAACAAGAIALGTALRKIRNGLHTCIVAGGVDSLLFPYGIHAFSSLGALTENDAQGPAAISPFDKKRSGTLLGEGAAYLVLEAEASAIARHRPILAEFVGFGASMDAYNWVAPEPAGKGPTKAMKAALADACLQPQEIGYVNAHGTGTQQNDVMECQALNQVFGEYLPKIPVSSTKPFVGHLLTAAGAIEAVASLLPFCHGYLPPTLNFQFPDPACPIDPIPNVARRGTPDYVMSNSYGLGGQNASLIFGKYVALGNGLKGGSAA